MASLTRPMKLNVIQVNRVIGETRKVLFEIVKQIKNIFDESNIELNIAKEKYIVQINIILKQYNIDKVFAKKTPLSVINRFLDNFKSNVNLTKAVKLSKNEVDKFFDRWRQNEYLLECYTFESFFKYINKIYNNSTYNRDQIYSLSVKLSDVIDFHEDTIKKNTQGYTNSQIHFSKEGNELVNTFELIVLEHLYLFLQTAMT